MPVVVMGCCALIGFLILSQVVTNPDALVGALGSAHVHVAAPQAKHMGAVAFERFLYQRGTSPAACPALAGAAVTDTIEGGPRALMTCILVMSLAWYLSAGYPPARPARRG